MPDPMRIQMGLIYEGLKAFNIPIYTKEGFEADDVIGTISKRACDLGHKVYILTGDQDSFQLIRENGCVTVIIPSKGELTEYDWNKVHEKLGVYPNQVIDYKALRGDTSDNIPGIRGIGEKTAVKLLSEYKTVDNVLANTDKLTGKVKEKIETGVEDAKLSKFLATIVQDVDIEFDFDKTKIELPDIAAVTEFLRSMQFYSFLKNIEFILKLFDKNAQPFAIEVKDEIKEPMEIQPVIKVSTANGQLGLFAQAVQSEVNKEDLNYNSKVITDSSDLDSLVENLSNKAVIAFKIFADFKNAINSKVYGIGIGYSKNYGYQDGKVDISDASEITETFYIPVSHNIDNQLKLDYVVSKLKPVFESSKVKKVSHDVKIEDCILKSLGIDLEGVVFDTMLASYIKDSNANTDFDIQCMEQIDHILPTIVSDTKKTSVADNNMSVMKDYAGDVISSLFELTKCWSDKLDEKEYNIMTDIEIPLAHVLAGMEITGVSVDTAYLKILTNEFDFKISGIEKKIFNLSGEGFNLNSPKQIAHILFDKMQLKTTKKRGKSKNSTSAEVLNILAEDYEIARLILEYRKYAKLKSTYTDSLPALIDPKDNRIHTSYNQTVTTTGRLSSSNPNLQNIPIRTEEGNKIRQAFVPKDKNNYLILSADYSQVELRILAHVSGDKNLINAFNSGIDVHTITASKVFEVPIDEVTKEMRYKAKAVNFGIVYGQSKYGLAKGLKITAAEADNFINKYFETYPGIKDYMHNMVELVEKQGYVETIFGRRRYLENEINSPNAMIREFAKRAAINHPMQGSASDLIKIAMIDFAKAIKDNNLKSRLIIQVHDELVVETAIDELDIVKKLILESMELKQPLKVPLLIDVNAGESWKE